MTAHNNDERIRAAFDDVKGDDGVARSTYSRVLARGEPQRARLHTSPVFRLAAAALVIAAVGTTYRMVVREPKLTVPNEVVALTTWRPETDVLLASPTKLFQAQAQIRQSMIDLDTLTRGVVQ
jgi:hypothetical protein